MRKDSGWSNTVLTETTEGWDDPENGKLWSLEKESLEKESTNPLLLVDVKESENESEFENELPPELKEELPEECHDKEVKHSWIYFCTIISM